MAKTFRGPKTPLTRSQYGKKPRQARDAKLAGLRGKERGEYRPDVFEKAADVGKPKKPKK